MTTDYNARLARFFPTADEIPPENELAAPVHQRGYLIDGQILLWDGPCKTVRSPVCTRDAATGEVSQVEIGSYPLMEEAQSDAALEAAVAAYDSGRGQWPTMTVAGRIACMQTFVKGMVERRQQIVNLLMWEIGKSLADSRKEFDRTIEYIQATIEALKDVENDHSRFMVVEGTIGQVRRTPLGVVLCMGPYN